MKTKIEVLDAEIHDHISDLLYYDRKEDPDLSIGDIEYMIESGETSVEKIVEMFEHYLREGLGE